MHFLSLLQSCTTTTMSNSNSTSQTPNATPHLATLDNLTKAKATKILVKLRRMVTSPILNNSIRHATITALPASFPTLATLDNLVTESALKLTAVMLAKFSWANTLDIFQQILTIMSSPTNIEDPVEQKNALHLMPRKVAFDLLMHHNQRLHV